VEGRNGQLLLFGGLEKAISNMIEGLRYGLPDITAMFIKTTFLLH
jgi:hypothetical protein